MMIEHLTLWPYLLASLILTALSVAGTFWNKFGLVNFRLWGKHLARMTTHYFVISQIFFWALWFTSRLFLHFSWSLF